MKTSLQSLAIATAIALSSAVAPVYAASNPMVGGAPMLVTKDIVDGYYAEEAAKVLDPVKTFLAAEGVTGYAVQLRHGHASEEIVEAAKGCGAGLIVMGTHGHGMFGRALMGSVATKVIAESPVSVLLVK